jgi:hypothetical protein
MITALLFAAALQESSVTRDKWDDIAKLWKDVAAVVKKAESGGMKPTESADLDDAFLDAAGRVIALFKESKDAESLAIKGVLKSRLLHGLKFMSPQQDAAIMGRMRVVVRGMGREPEEEKVDIAKELDGLEKSYAKLSGDEGEKTATKAVETLVKIKAIPAETEGWQLRTVAKMLRALETGKAHPMKDAPALTDETKAKVASLIKQLGADEQTARDEAEAKLIEIGDAIVPLLKAELKVNEDAEVLSRLKRILGVK